MKRTWWKECVVYQIYPRSFYDSNGDGIGDLRGIIQKLDYLQQLGVGVVWLCPIYASPNDDNGYDISDYHAIQAEFGSMADWEELLAELHRHGIKLLMDLVVNHTSDEHPWFVASRAPKENPYRDFYIWRPGKGDGPPNNWQSLFGGSAWQYDAATGKYYLHLFSRKQPDLNWENPALREAIYAMMDWWLDKGVDGFRLDAINLISKAAGLPDAPVTTDSRYQFPGALVFNGPRLVEFLREMKTRVLEPRDVFTVGETSLVTTEHAIALTDEGEGPLNMLFQFEHMDLDKDRRSVAPRWSRQPWSLLELKRLMTRWQKELEQRGWNSQYLSNHDLPRAVSRFGDDGRYRIESAKLLATFLHMLQGTPYIYQGEEIGMTNVAFESITDYRDIETLNMYREFVEERGRDPQEVLALIHALSRDNARTPMQWDASPQAGFSAGRPWIKLNPNYATINVQQALADPQSIWHYYRRLIALRAANPTIVYGRYDLLLAEHPAIYAFTRTLQDDRLLVVLNFGASTPTFAWPDELGEVSAELLIGNYLLDPHAGLRRVDMRPFEARVYRLGKPR
jgi:oligo-1,6-glucosidase